MLKFQWSSAEFNRLLCRLQKIEKSQSKCSSAKRPTYGYLNVSADSVRSAVGNNP